MRVLLETSCLADGRAEAGIGRYARQLQRALAALPGLDIAATDPGPPRSESRPGRFVHAQPAALRLAARFHPHIVHGVGGEPLLGFPATRQVVTVHDVELWRGAGPGGPRGRALGLYAHLQTRLLRRCAAVIADSPATAREAIETLGLDPLRVHVVALGVNRIFVATPAPWDDEALGRYGLTRDGYLLWTGSLRRHDPRKDVDLLIDAVARLDDARPLVMAGAGGAEAERVAEVARAHGVSLIRCGSVSDLDLAALYRHAACAVISSRHEGFGLPALEAMASGCAVVSTDGGNLGELVGGAGVTVPAGDAEALTRGLREVLSRAAQREELRRRGIARAREFSWEAAATATARVYRDVAAATAAAA